MASLNVVLSSDYYTAFYFCILHVYFTTEPGDCQNVCR